MYALFLNNVEYLLRDLKYLRKARLSKIDSTIFMKLLVGSRVLFY